MTHTSRRVEAYYQEVVIPQLDAGASTEELQDIGYNSLNKARAEVPQSYDQFCQDKENELDHESERLVQLGIINYKTARLRASR